MRVTYSCSDTVCDEIAIRDLTRVGDQDLEFRILVQYLLNASIVATFLRLKLCRLSILVFTQILRPRIEGRVALRRRL